jgi:hypothetical protein
MLSRLPRSSAPESTETGLGMGTGAALVSVVSAARFGAGRAAITSGWSTGVPPNRPSNPRTRARAGLV